MMAPRMIHTLTILSVFGIYQLNCLAQSPSSTRATTGYSINAQLVNVTQNEDFLAGALELSRNSLEWSKVCDRHLTTNAARVVCRMFGYQFGEGMAGGRLGQSNGQMLPNKFACNGSETDLSLCVISTVSGSCTYTAGLVCFNNISKVLEMRVVDEEPTSYQIQGRLEVRLKPFTNWGSVCDDRFSAIAALAACQYMGYKHGEIAREGGYGSSNGTLLDDVYCRTGQQFFSCDHNIWANHDCSSIEDTYITCTMTSVKLLSAVKTNISQHVGSVEVFLNKGGGWYEVCDDGWDDQDAKVVCAELGFFDGRALLRNSLGRIYYGSLTALGSVTNVSCIGNETVLASCQMTETSLCRFEGSVLSLAAVICYSQTVNENEFRTDAARISSKYNVPITTGVGFLEIRHMGLWGLVCEDRNIFMDKVLDEEATVACKMINPEYIAGKRLGRVIVNYEFHVWLRGFSCNGTENSITECRTPAWGSPGLVTCKEPVRIACYKQACRPVRSITHWISCRGNVSHKPFYHNKVKM